MHFTRLMMSAVALMLGFAAWPATTVARDLQIQPLVRSYTGSYPFQINADTTRHNTYSGCLTLTDTGLATAVIGTQKYTYGTFSILNGILVATIQAPGYGQNAGLVFITDAKRELRKGYFDEVYGGEAFVTGKLTFGVKGSC